MKRAVPFHERPESRRPDASGTFLRAYRTKAGLSQEKLGAKVGVTQGMISQWEGGTVDLTLPDIQALAKALGTTPKHLQYRHPNDRRGIEDIFDELPDTRQADLLDIANNWLRKGPE